MRIQESSPLGAESRLAGHGTEAEWAVTAQQVWVEHFRPGTWRTRGKEGERRGLYIFHILPGILLGSFKDGLGHLGLPLTSMALNTHTQALHKPRWKTVAKASLWPKWINTAQHDHEHLLNICTTLFWMVVGRTQGM